MPSTEPQTGRYSVYLVDKAADALGPIVAPFLKKDDSGDHFIASEVDTGGSFCELTLHGQSAEGTPLNVEIMIPMGMIRLIISDTLQERIGFQAREPAKIPVAGL